MKKREIHELFLSARVRELIQKHLQDAPMQFPDGPKNS